MKTSIFCILLFCSAETIFSQSVNTLSFAGNSQFWGHQEIILSKEDSIWLSSLPSLSINSYKSLEYLPELPSQLNNAQLPYFRPIFTQQQWPSCGQAAGVAYNFTYEINRSRDLPANIPENQFPTHYVWNFSNGGYGYSGSSYFHSFEILRSNGSPTVDVYGGIDYGGGSRWMSGYQNYYQGMHHRINGVYKIDVGTPEGLFTLKHWLHNHLQGSETGGVASFYANAPWNLSILPDGTPEAGKWVIARWNGEPTHAMTVVGYNDSIRWDYNNDGIYTNHLDTNGDGIVDMRDWELGGLIFANSYGSGWADQGFCYMMYKTLADYVLEGGIWNYSMHVLDVKSDYYPLLTAKITLKHTCRNMIKVQTGVSVNPIAEFPEFTLDFPIFDFQGGCLFMQGGNGEEDKTIEFGLDITPLLKHLENGETGRFFLQITEYDPDSEHSGEIISYSIIDYTGSEPVEHHCPETSTLLINNGITLLGVNAVVNHDAVAILNNELPVVANGSLFVQMQAGGGLPPYRWTLHKTYNEHVVSYTPPVKTLHTEKVFPGWNQWVTKNLEFSFPYYDTAYQQITVYPNGFIMFGNEPFPYPYWLFPSVMLTNFKCIAPFIAFDLRQNTLNYDTIWFETGSSHIRINWDLTLETGSYQTPHSFSALLHADGRIEFHYEAFSFGQHCIWMAGISNGDRKNFMISPISGIQELESNRATGFTPVKLPEDLCISSEGLLSYQEKKLGMIYEISVNVEDNRWISATKKFQLTDALMLEYSPFGGPIIPGNLTNLDVLIKNISAFPVSGLHICFESPGDPLINWTQSCLDAGNFSPGQVKEFTESIKFYCDPQAPDNHLVKIEGNLDWDGLSKKKVSNFNVKRTQLEISHILLNGNPENTVLAGQYYDLKANISNLGNIPEHNISVVIGSQDPFFILLPPLDKELQVLNHNSNATLEFQIGIHHNAPEGYEGKLTLSISADNIPVKNHDFSFVVGGKRILIINLDPDNSSAPSIKKVIENQGFISNTINTLSLLPSGYSLMMLCLGRYPNRYILTFEDSEKLVAFLQNGGSIYMEGGSTWKGDPRRPIHNLFMIEGKAQGWAAGIDSLAGNPNSIASNFNFKYKGFSIRMDNLEPMDPAATVLFTNVPTSYHYSILYESQVYKTIGSSFKFNGLHQNPEDTIPSLLMKEYLRFFGFDTDVLSANFTSDTHLICNGESVAFQLKCKGNIKNVLWEFQGGTPAFSTHFSPVVHYGIPGTWSVKLVVHDENTADSLYIENYITVDLCSGIPVPAKSVISIYPNPANDRLIIKTDNSEEQEIWIRIFNANGTKVFEKQFTGWQNSRPASLDVSRFSNGIYLIQLLGKNEFTTKKIIISH